jgi:hypothetical protein
VHANVLLLFISLLDCQIGMWPILDHDSYHIQICTSMIHCVVFIETIYQRGVSDETK